MEFEFDNNILLIIGAVVLGLGLLFFKFFYSKKTEMITETHSTSIPNTSHENMQCDGDKCSI